MTVLSVRRCWHALRKLTAGVPLGGEAVWPALRNDLFVAHESIYRFAAGHARGLDVLDAGCGMGYGSLLLAAAGARSVVGLDLDRRRIRYARRRYRAEALSFVAGDCERLELPEGSFDLVVSSNALEHLHAPEQFLDGAARVLRPEGLLIAAVPPVLSAADLAVHGRNDSHLSNLSVRGWAELFERCGWRARFFGHRCRRPLDFASYRPSRARPTDFELTEEPLEAAYERPPITAVYLLSRS